MYLYIFAHNLHDAMVEIVTEQRLILRCQKKLIRHLKKTCKEKINCSVGYKGKSIKTYVYYSSDYNFWFTSSKGESHYCNTFGYGKPHKGRNNSITVEINIPFKEIDRRIGGAFGYDLKGEVMLLHRGRIGGGRKGIGKKLLFERYGDETILVDDGGVISEFCLIGSFNSEFLPMNIGHFISEVFEIKNLSGSISPNV